MTVGSKNVIIDIYMKEIMYTMIELYTVNDKFREGIELGYSPNIQSFIYLVTKKPIYTLEEVLLISSNRKATIEEDKIYGLMGICQELNIEIKYNIGLQNIIINAC